MRAAVEAAVGLVRDFGFHVDAPRVLHRAKSTIVHRIRSTCVAVSRAAEPRRAPEVAQEVDVHVRVLRHEALA